MPLSLRASYFLRYFTCPPPRLPGIISSCKNALRESCKRDTTRILGVDESRFSSQGIPGDRMRGTMAVITRLAPARLMDAGIRKEFRLDAASLDLERA